MDKIYHQYDGLPVIPPEKMYFITIDDLDIICAMAKEEGISLSEMIDFARNADEKPETRKFDFIQHLQAMPEDTRIPNYLIEKKEQIFEKLKKLLMR